MARECPSHRKDNFRQTVNGCDPVTDWTQAMWAGDTAEPQIYIESPLMVDTAVPQESASVQSALAAFSMDQMKGMGIWEGNRG